MAEPVRLNAFELDVGASVSGEPHRPALVLLHGWPQSRALYDGVLEPLTSEFFVLAMDLPGMGESRGVPSTGERRFWPILCSRLPSVPAHMISLLPVSMSAA
jgi:pimeloyl-ACP methyl ester carboxylesterase